MNNAHSEQTNKQTQDERQDGIAMDSRFKDQGRVPLFYVDDKSGRADSSSVDDGSGAVSVYFARKDLVSAWNRQHPGEPLPTIKAIDLVGIFEAILRGRATTGYLPTTDLVFVPNEEAVSVAKEMKARGLAPYNPGKMII